MYMRGDAKMPQKSMQTLFKKGNALLPTLQFYSFHCARLRCNNDYLNCANSHSNATSTGQFKERCPFYRVQLRNMTIQTVRMYRRGDAKMPQKSMQTLWKKGNALLPTLQFYSFHCARLRCNNDYLNCANSHSNATSTGQFKEQCPFYRVQLRNMTTQLNCANSHCNATSTVQIVSAMLLLLCKCPIKYLLKEALSRIINISLNSQNIHLCHRKPANNGLFLLAIAILVNYAKTVSKCLWLQMARMETDCNLTNWG